MKKLIYILLFLTLNVAEIVAQHPQYFSYDIENGLPSNEVYSIVQDQKGFIWIGCDAGLFKFDGVRYTAYKCATQKSKSITGLTFSSSGRLYCYNFQSQIFYLENIPTANSEQALTELKHTLPNASFNSLTSDLNGNIYVAHAGGISAYNENQKQWKNFFETLPDNVIQNATLAGKAEKGDFKKNIRFIYSKGITEIINNKVELKYETDVFRTASPANYELENYNNSLWIFSKENGTIYRYNSGKFDHLTNTRLNEILATRKVTNVKALSDGNLWICTYKGIIRFNQKNNTADLLYPELSFSDCMIDREHNYWFSTLHSGILRVPNLSFNVWNRLENNRLAKITTDKTHIFFASVNGTIGKLNALTGELKTYHTGNNADVQSFDYDFRGNTLYFNINNRLYKLNSNKLDETKTSISAIKSYRIINNTSFALSSQGVFINGKKVNYEWARELKYDEQNETIWIATNNGLQKYNLVNSEWRYKETTLSGKQILSIDFNEIKREIFALTFDGKIYNQTGAEIGSLSSNVQAQKIKYHHQKLYVATNKGVWIHSLEGKQWKNLNSLSGLVSENVQDLIILDNMLWLATGKGLQKIPLDELDETNSKTPLAKIYLKDKYLISMSFQINYNDILTLNPEASIYSSNGNFQYAYRINKADWIKLPANIEQLEIQNLPTGNIEIELKAIDHFGRDSENIITLKGYVNPPFYKTWWFIFMIVFMLFALAYLFYKSQLSKQRKEYKRQNELNIAKLTAIRSQMNPHFIFNSLNSIQDLILQKKTVESYDYVVLFSELVRNALNYSNKEFISIREEIEFLETYLQLEQLRFKNDLHYQILYEGTDEIDVPSLMIQPVVENALFHGLLHKDGPKELIVRFTFDEESLICTIEDNGIGRNQADSIRVRQGQKHNSFALEAIQKRMNIFNEQQGKTIGQFSFEDINPNEEDTGTRVIIRLPFKRKY